MIVISGAEGFNGTEIVHQLRAIGEPVRALIADLGKAAALEALGAEAVPTDPLSADALAQGFAGAERAILVPPNTEDQVEREESFIQAAREAGVRHLVKFSAAGASPTSHALILRRHAQAEETLRQSGVPYTVISPVWFMQNLIPLAPTIASTGVVALPMAQGRAAAVDIRDVAATVVGVLTRPEHEGKTYLATGPQSLSFAEIAEQVAELSGRAVRYDAISGDAFRDTLLGYGQPAWFAEALVELFAAIAAGEQAAVTSTVRDVTGREPRLLRTFLADHARTFASSNAALAEPRP